jgi:hypothetical protein
LFILTLLISVLSPPRPRKSGREDALKGNAEELAQRKKELSSQLAALEANQNAAIQKESCWISRST